jgi:ribosomal protein L24E
MGGRIRRVVVAAIAAVCALTGLVAFAGRSVAATDTAAPSLVTLALTPGTVDTEDDAVTVTVEARIIDDTGVSIGGSVPLTRLELTGPGGLQRSTVYLSRANRVSGTDTDGVYRAAATMRRQSEPGRWTAALVLVDAVGNSRTLAAADLRARGLPDGVDQTGAGDLNAPELAALSVAPASVDTSLNGATLSIAARVIDDRSGVSDGNDVAASQVVMRGPTGTHEVRATLDGAHRSAGDALDATFSVAVSLPRWSEQGTWTVASVVLIDEVGNRRVVQAPDVTFTQVGIGDIVRPQARTFAMGASAVDVRNTSATIAMSARLTDDRSGVADGVTTAASELLFVSPSGREQVIVAFGVSQRVSGTAIDGTYSATARIAAHAEGGTWRLQQAWISDRARNAASLNAADWSALGFASTFSVVSDAQVTNTTTRTPPTTAPPLTSPSTTPGPTSASNSTTTTAAGSTTTVSATSTTSSTLAPAGGSTTTVPGTTTTSPTISTVATTTTAPIPPTLPPVTDVTTTTTVRPGVGTEGTRVRQVNGYWFVTKRGSVSGFGGAARTKSSASTAADAVGITPTPTGKGYWVVYRDGGVHAAGDARNYGSMRGRPLARPVVGMAPTPNGRGYWLVATDGGIFSFGNAKFYGSTGAIRLNQPIVGMTASPTGRGYWFVASDGGIFSFGDAKFYGSTGAIRLNQPVVGMAAAPDGKGYWLVARDGGIFAFGRARFYGSTGAIRLNQPIVGMATAPSGKGYMFVAADGGIFSFGKTRFFGSLGASPPPSPVVGMAMQVS